MRTNALVAVLVSALVIAGLGAGGALAATGPLQPQQSTTNTTTTAPTASGGSATDAATSDGSASTAAASDGPSITFDDQQSSGETVLIQSATLPANGFIVINGTSDGTERVLGSSYLLNAGLADNVRIQLNQPINGSASLTAILYTDSNGNGAFDADADQPVYQGDSDRRIVDIADVTVQSSSGTPTSAEDDSAGGSTSAATATAADSGGAETAAASGDGTSAESNGSSGNASGESTSSNGPGFGPVVALVALLAVAFLARRR